MAHPAIPPPDSTPACISRPSLTRTRYQHQPKNDLMIATRQHGAASVRCVVSDCIMICPTPLPPLGGLTGQTYDAPTTWSLVVDRMANRVETTSSSTG